MTEGGGDMYFNVQFQCLDCECYFENADSPRGSGGSRCPKCDSTKFRPLNKKERKEINETLSLGFMAVDMASFASV
jgi:predicted  nucleic acid-binding Zn-ribbon protein